MHIRIELYDKAHAKLAQSTVERRAIFGGKIRIHRTHLKPSGR
jgi:hypothetical protein